MNQNTEYKVSEGHKEDFERECDRLANIGYYSLGSMSMWQKGGKFWYAQLMSKNKEIVVETKQPEKKRPIKRDYPSESPQPVDD